MSHKQQAEEQPDEEPEEPSGASPAAGACVLAVLAGIVLAVVFAVSREVGVLALLAVAVTALWWSVRRTANPAPPPPSERGYETKPQFRIVEDRPGHCTVHWSNEV